MRWAFQQKSLLQLRGSSDTFNKTNIFIMKYFKILIHFGTLNILYTGCGTLNILCLGVVY